MELDVVCGILNTENNFFLPLDPGQTAVIGRSDEADVKIDDKRCSRFHAEVAHVRSKTDQTSTILLTAKGKYPLLVLPKHKKNHQLYLNAKQQNEQNKDETIIIPQYQSQVLHEGDEFSLLLDLSAKLIYRIQILKTKAQNQINNQDLLNTGAHNKSAPPSPRKMEMDSPNNKRKNEDDSDEIQESPTKQTKNYHQPQQNNNNNQINLQPHHGYNNNNGNHAHHKPQVYYNSEDEEEQNNNNHKTQNNNMDDYIQDDGNKVAFVYKPDPKQKKSTFIDYRPGPDKKGQIPIPKGNKNCLAGKVFLITGILDSLERDEATKLIEFYKGKVVTGIQLSLTHAVVGKLPGPKKEEALKKLKDQGKIEIINQTQLFNMIMNLPAITDEDAKELNSPKKKVGSPSPKKKASPKKGGKAQDKTPPKQDNNNNKKDNKHKDNDNDNKNKDDDDNNEKRKSKKDKAGREACMYGAECYRKNPQHRIDFAHPGDPDYKPS